MSGYVCPVHGEWCPTGICRWCEKQPLPGLKGIWATPDRVEVNEAGVPSYFWDLGPPPKLLPPTFMCAGEDAIAVHWKLDFTPQVCPEDLMAAREADLVAEHAAPRWERVARRWGAKRRPLLRVCVTVWFPKEWP